MSFAWFTVVQARLGEALSCSEAFSRGYSEKVPTATGSVSENDRGRVVIDGFFNQKDVEKRGDSVKITGSILLTAAGWHGRVKHLRAYHPLKVGRSPF
jgi:hypothetical protein